MIFSKWKSKRFPHLTENKNKWFRTQRLAFFLSTWFSVTWCLSFHPECGSWPSPLQTGLWSQPFLLAFRPQNSTSTVKRDESEKEQSSSHVSIWYSRKWEKYQDWEAHLPVEFASVVYIADLMRRQRNGIKSSFLNFIFMFLWCKLFESMITDHVRWSPAPSQGSIAVIYAHQKYVFGKKNSCKLFASTNKKLKNRFDRNNKCM